MPNPPAREPTYFPAGTSRTTTLYRRGQSERDEPQAKGSGRPKSIRNLSGREVDGHLSLLSLLVCLYYAAGMTDLLAARTQMAVSLGFHIIFASIGIAMPFLMAVAHARWLKTRDPQYKKLTQSWAKGVAIFFATGAVSGTALSFELGLLWPTFMEHAGPLIGMPFSWEGTAFFLEAIALGLFLYGWDRLPEKAHWVCGLVVGISGVMSAFFVICANGWMNTPTGFVWANGQFTEIDPIKAMFNPSALHQGIHMVVAAFEATGFAVAGIHAWLLIKQPHLKSFHEKAVRIALVFGGVAALIQPLTGDFAAKEVARYQPLKLAAMEGLAQTQTHAPLTLGPVQIPGLLSFLAYGRFDAEVKGYEAFPKENRPPIGIVHFSFQGMILLGMWLAFLGLLYFFLRFRNNFDLSRQTFLRKLFVLSIPLGFIATELGWIVTEVGRQPWIIYGIMRTKDALTPMPGLQVPFLLFTLLYLFLWVLVSWLLVRQIQALEKEPQHG